MSGLLTCGDVSHVVDDVIALAAEMRDRGYQADRSTARFWRIQVGCLGGRNAYETADVINLVLLSDLEHHRRCDLGLDWAEHPRFGILLARRQLIANLVLHSICH